MSIWWLTPLFALAYMSYAQEPENSTRPGPVDLVSPSGGSPLSVQQIEERVRNLPNGSSTVEIVKSTIYRDSAGRMRIESIPSGSGDSPTVFLIDPTNGFRVALSPGDKSAYRIVGAKAGENGFVHGVGGMGQALPSGAWRTNIEKLGRRTIDGIEVEGQRVTQTSSDQPSLAAVYERWHSDELKLDCLAVSSGPGWNHTARIHSVSRQEPDPSLFAVPHDYTIHDLKLPSRPEP